MKRLLALAMTLLMLISVSACGDIVEAVTNRLDGDVIGEVEKEYETAWFALRINSLGTMETYKGVDAEEGYTFLVANVYEKNTWTDSTNEKRTDPLPMSCWDFYALEGESTEMVYAEAPWDEAMMPDEFYLDEDEEATYDVVFMVSEDVADVSFVYVEEAEDNTTYATFTIKHKLADSE